MPKLENMVTDKNEAVEMAVKGREEGNRARFNVKAKLYKE